MMSRETQRIIFKRNPGHEMRGSLQIEGLPLLAAHNQLPLLAFDFLPVGVVLFGPASKPRDKEVLELAFKNRCELEPRYRRNRLNALKPLKDLVQQPKRDIAVELRQIPLLPV